MSHLHDYVPVLQTKEGVLEVCSECKKRLMTRFDRSGRPDKNYAIEHLRDTAQPNGRTAKIFNKYYNKKK